MSKSRKLAIPVLIMLMLLAGALSASAGGPVTVTHESAGGTVDWSMSPAQCDQLQVLLTGTGKRHMEMTTKVYADGSSEILINDLVMGTAWDTTGTYHFIYTNHSTETVPADGGAHKVEMVDSFVLNGSGSAKLNVGFNWRWTFDPPGVWPPEPRQVISQRGDPEHCDPI